MTFSVHSPSMTSSEIAFSGIDIRYAPARVVSAEQHDQNVFILREGVGKSHGISGTGRTERGPSCKH
jgi:hypothetical protein